MNDIALTIVPLNDGTMLVVETGQVVPTTFSGSSGGSPGGPPPPSDEEKAAYKKQAQATDLYLEIARKQQATADSLEPYLFKQLGLEKVAVRGEREALIDKYTEQLKKIPQYVKPPTGTRYLTDPRTGIGFPNDPELLMNPEYKRVSDLLEKAKGMLPKYEVREMAPTPEELQRREIQDLSNKRTIAALKGDLPVDPSVEQDITRGKSQLIEELARRGIRPGSGDVYSRAISEFERGANALRYDVRTGERSAADAIASNRQNELMRKQAQYIGGSREYQAGSSSAIAGAASGYGSIGRNLSSNRFTGANMLMQQQMAEGQGMSSLIGGGIGAAGMIGAAYLI